MSSSLSICRTLNLREKSFPVPRSSETATAWSVAAIGLVSLRKIFLPTKFSYPKFRGSGPRSSTRSIPTARPGPAQLNRFPINKTADRGQEDCMGRNISQAAGRRDQNPSILPPKGGTTHSKKSVSEKFSYQQNFPTPNSEARGRGLPPVQCPPPGTARPSSTIFPINKTAGSGQEDFGVLAASDG